MWLLLAAGRNAQYAHIVLVYDIFLIVLHLDRGQMRTHGRLRFQ